MSMIGNLLAVSAEQLAAIVQQPSLVEALVYPEDGAEKANHLDIDKSWHAIHYMLNGDAWEGEEPFFLVVLGGEEIGEDVGYGPARYLKPDQVKAVASALSSLDLQDFSHRFDPSAMDAAEIYPQSWGEGGSEEREYLLDYFKQLSSFYQSAAQRNDAVLLYLN
jgi:hypothetical protein